MYLGLVSGKPRKLFVPAKPVSGNLYLKTERCIRLKLLVWRQPLFLWIKQFCNHKVWVFATASRVRKLSEPSGTDPQKTLEWLWCWSADRWHLLQFVPTFLSIFVDLTISCRLSIESIEYARFQNSYFSNYKNFIRRGNCRCYFSCNLSAVWSRFQPSLVRALYNVSEEKVTAPLKSEGARTPITLPYFNNTTQCIEFSLILGWQRFAFWFRLDSNPLLNHIQ